MVWVLFLIVVCFSSAKFISVVIMPAGNVPNINMHLATAYMRHLYSSTSTDMVELRFEDRVIMPWTSIREEHKIVYAILHSKLEHSAKPCVDDYPLNTLTPETNIVYIVTDNEPCRPQFQNANRLKQRGITVFPIGFGRGISQKTLRLLAGPCNTGTCLPGWNYLHVE